MFWFFGLETWRIDGGVKDKRRRTRSKERTEPAQPGLFYEESHEGQVTVTLASTLTPVTLLQRGVTPATPAATATATLTVNLRTAMAVPATRPPEVDAGHVDVRRGQRTSQNHR